MGDTGITEDRRKMYKEAAETAKNFRYKIGDAPMNESRQRDKQLIKDAIGLLTDDERNALMTAIGVENEGVLLRSKDQAIMTTWATYQEAVAALRREVDLVASSESDLIKHLTENHVLYDELLRRQKRHPEEVQALWRGESLSD
ncbi:MAG: hypothetical protein H0T73_16260 [Ardenticatenales bacterium]|nr:hypothetical protein [Ardenticatenales bacterium]